MREIFRKSFKSLCNENQHAFILHTILQSEKYSKRNRRSFQPQFPLMQTFITRWIGLSESKLHFLIQLPSNSDGVFKAVYS